MATGPKRPYSVARPFLLTPHTRTGTPMKKSPLLRLLRQKLKTAFLAGILVTGPIVLTVMVVQWFVLHIDNILYNLLPTPLHPETIIGFRPPGLGLVLGLVAILLIGVFTANYLGQRLLRLVEMVLYRIPLVRPIYALLKQVTDTTIGKDRKGFRRVVLVEYPRREIWSIGFVTGVTEGEVQDKTAQRVLNIFIPTTPNPTSGFLLMVPEKDTIALSMSVDDAFKLIISGGMFTPAVKGREGRRPPGRPGEPPPSTPAVEQEIPS
ncbi:MAG: DUF502 domain-containing protein [Thermodesulfobacteriota bacterium]